MVCMVLLTIFSFFHFAKLKKLLAGFLKYICRGLFGVVVMYQVEVVLLRGVSQKKIGARVRKRRASFKNWFEKFGGSTLFKIWFNLVRVPTCKHLD